MPDFRLVCAIPATEIEAIAMIVKSFFIVLLIIYGIN